MAPKTEKHNATIKSAVKKNKIAKPLPAKEQHQEDLEEHPPTSSTNVGTNAEIRQHLKLNTKEQLQAASQADVATETESEVSTQVKAKSLAKAHTGAKSLSKVFSKAKSRDEDDQ